MKIRKLHCRAKTQQVWLAMFMLGGRRRERLRRQLKGADDTKLGHLLEWVWKAALNEPLHGDL